jgi:Na+-translocating ferredoxin:NAD+ oxidoreductase RnfC subunit
VASARRAIWAYAAELAAGLAAVKQATGARRAVVAVERRAGPPPGVEAVLVDDVARCGEPADLAHDVAGVRVAPGADPLAAGVLVLDAAAVVALGAGAPVVERTVTVAGDVARPGVGRVPVGVSIEELVAAAGGATCGPAWVALGDGPLAGRPMDRDDVVGKATRAVFVAAAGSDLVRRARLPLGDAIRRSLAACERCSMCADVCPPRLLGGRLRPDELVRALSTPTIAREELAAAVECSSCGLCDVACPSGLSPRALVEAAARALAGTTPPDPGPPHEMRSARRLSIALVARRLGLGDAPPDLPWEHWSLVPSRVELPLKSSLGVAATPTVRPGQRVERGAVVAIVPDGLVGTAVHASIAGTVIDIARGALILAR